ncbi:MAG: HEPN domain-containing protein [Methylobacter sp.]|nr:HEPN domain-containing protein [Methylobacter sp.]
MQRAIEKFRQNIKSVKELDSIFGLITINYPLLEEQAQEILRAEIVLSVSALDCFIHDLIKQGMVETYQDNRTPSSQFSTYQIPVKFLKLIEKSDRLDDKLAYLENAIKENNSKDSYQSPKGIEYALQLINITSLWKKVASLMNLKAEDIKGELSLIVDRRNKIAHEADYDALTGSKYPIDRQNINDVIQFIENFCESIYKIAQNEK